MSDFHARWRDLAAAARRAPGREVPAPPARLLFLDPWPEPEPSWLGARPVWQLAAALAMLYVVAAPLALPAWDAAREVRGFTLADVPRPPAIPSPPIPSVPAIPRPPALPSVETLPALLEEASS